jgi:hypothetical protein
MLDEAYAQRVAVLDIPRLVRQQGAEVERVSHGDRYIHKVVHFIRHQCELYGTENRRDGCVSSELLDVLTAHESVEPFPRADTFDLRKEFI